MKIIKAAVAKRYNANSKALDLSWFHTAADERMVMYNTHTQTEIFLWRITHIEILTLQSSL
jgi:hypothetical protein